MTLLHYLIIESPLLEMLLDSVILSLLIAPVLYNYLINKTNELLCDIKDKQEKLDILSDISEERSLRATLCSISKELNIDYIILGELLNESKEVRTLELVCQGQKIENLTYGLVGTPCELALDSKHWCVYPEGVQEAFPRDKLLEELDVNSYFGAQLIDSSGEIIGIFCFLTKRKINKDWENFYRLCLKIFSVRFRSELEKKQLDLKLNQVQAKHETFFNMIPNPLIIINSSGIIQSANAKTSDLFGHGRDELIGHNISMLMPSPEAEMHDSYIKRYLETGVAKVIGTSRHVNAMKKNGDIFPAIIYIYSFKYNGETLFGGFLSDFTELEEAQKALSNSRKYMEDILQSLSEMLFVLNRNGTIKMINKKVSELSKYSPGDIEGLPIGTLIKEEDEKLKIDDFSRFYEIIEKGGARDIRAYCITKSCEKVPVLVSGSIMRDESGETTAVIIYAKDAKDSKILRELQVAQKVLEEYTDFPVKNPAPVMRLNTDGEITLANSAAGNFFDDSKLVGQCWFDLCHDVTMEKLRDLAQSGTTFQHEISRSNRNIRLEYVPFGENVIGVYGFDITELKLAQSLSIQSSKLAALGEMSSGLAHELNNPLSFVKGFNNRIKVVLEKDEKTMKDDISELVKEIGYGAERMNTIISHFRDFSRLSENKVELVKVNDIVEHSIAMFAEQLKMKCIATQLDLCEDQPEIAGDGNRLQQVFVNLISNARDALDLADENLKKKNHSIY